MKKHDHKFDRRFCSECLQRVRVTYLSYDTGTVNLINIGEALCLVCLDKRIAAPVPIPENPELKPEIKFVPAMKNNVIDMDEYKREKRQQYLKKLNQEYLEKKNMEEMNEEYLKKQAGKA